ncbi:MAG: SPOR domain-containing protein [Zoogloeaceae bacterium]|jgi:DedD protein|nr:SPOR domain-containing protein [Zoogloeaceae bacterium]
MNDVDDVQLQVRKKARRRLVGAIVFFAVATLVLPVVMDRTPPPPPQTVSYLIPDQNGNTAPPDLAPLPPVPPEAASEIPPAPAPAPTVARILDTTPASGNLPTPQPVPQTAPAGVRPPISQPAEAKPGTEAQRAAAILAGQAADERGNAAAKTRQAEEARRAAAILAGNFPDSSAPRTTENANSNAQHIIRIGAYAQPASVENLKKKLGELGIRFYTEPYGEKTRVRAGPFPNRAAAEKALAKMQSILGVSGEIAAQ